MPRLLLLVAALALACASSRGPAPVAGPAALEEPEERPAPPAESYLTSAQPNGVVGGRAAEELAAQVAQALRTRGTEAVADGALAATAAWFLRETAEGRTPASHGGEQVARRHGFAGNLLVTVTAGLGGPDSDLWKRSLAEVPVNVPVTRFGVRASPAGVAAIAFGTVEADLRPIPRRCKPGQTVRVRGEIGKRFARAIVYLTGVDGKVQEHHLPSRQVEATLKFPVPGVYQAEVMGDGATGPVVLVNVPIYVGVPEPELGRTAGGKSAPAISTGEAEARMLVLLNAVRAQARVPALAADAELRAIALGHSEDMARAHFLGHVSPTTGTPEDRIKRAGVWLTGGGENIARAATADGAHEDLMSSPGHRANMLSPRFTHVGIAVVPEGDQILATLVFGRRRDPAAPWTPKEALEGIAALRRARGLPAAQEDHALQAAASAGMRAFAGGGSDAVFKETNEAIGREVQKRRATWRAGCVRIFEIADVDQLQELPVVLDPKLHRIGVGTATRTEGKATMLVLLIVSEGKQCD
jgi:uncharacterized protein YkwD